jgi:hypothetical protein
MCNPGPISTVCGLSNQVAQVVRTAFFCRRLHRGTAPYVSGASTLVATGDYPRYFAVPVRFERRQQQFYDQVSSQVRLKSRSGGRAVATNIFCVKCFLMSMRAWGFSRPEGVTNPLIASNT